MTKFSILLITLTLFSLNGFSQTIVKKSSNLSKQIIEKYYWKGYCNSKTNFLEKLTLEVYNDSTYIIIPVECRQLYNTKKEWKAHKRCVASGTWNIIDGQRKYFQGKNEMNLKQHNKYVAYKDSTVLKLVED